MSHYEELIAIFVDENKEMIRQRSRHGNISNDADTIGTILIEGIALIAQAIREDS